MALRQSGLDTAAGIRRLALAVGVGTVGTDDLQEFVEACDRLGGIHTPEAAEYVADFSLAYGTPIDPVLDGFDPAYAEQQLALYREVSGRDVDQEANEQGEVVFGNHLNAPNPYGILEPDRVPHHARTILTAYLVADVPVGGRVLDMGCGWGMSTELFAFCGCSVTAVDINPVFTELVAQRAEVRGYDVTTVHSSFDDFTSDEQFDLVFFYECLHHAIRPWTVLERLAGNVAPGGKIAFAGEPIQDLHWPQWGLRLDPQSVYCIRKYGWFENGWSSAFLAACFERAGFELTLMEGIGFQHGEIGVAVRAGEHDEPPSAHWAVPRGPGEMAAAPGAVERVARAVGRRVFR